MKIQIEINGNKMELEPAEARRVFEELSGVFAAEPVTVNNPVYIPLPQPYPVYPNPNLPWITYSTAPNYIGSRFSLSTEIQ